MRTKLTSVGYSPRRRAWFALQRLQPYHNTNRQSKRRDVVGGTPTLRRTRS
ncbi:MAG: hypothetical protein NZ874_05370 [Fimbriimonadales bacterium]|nr:hypothetical protein [Fimbriimonadales bacterium]